MAEAEKMVRPESSKVWEHFILRETRKFLFAHHHIDDIISPSGVSTLLLVCD